jgi:predicted RNA-binding Zn-ribbon protein involved in translation (DUF1610 family)
MGLLEGPEVIILKESSDAKNYLEKLEALKARVDESSDLAQKIEKEIIMAKAGIAGEEQILFELKNSGMDLVVIHDLYIEDPAGNGAQIDFLVITPYVNVFIECKNLFGNIEINEKGDFIRTMWFGKKFSKEGIYSPVAQNERHLRVLKECHRNTANFLKKIFLDKTFDKYNKSLIVLANPKTVVNVKNAPEHIKSQVIRADQLATVLRELKSDIKSSKKEILEFASKYLEMNIEGRTDYFAKYEALEKELNEQAAKTSSEHGTEKEEEDKEVMICPRCGAELVLRTATKGVHQGEKFYGCSAFPKCRYVKPTE